MSALPAQDSFSLARTELFRGLDPRHASAIAALGRVRVVGAGRELFSAGEPARALFVVREGTLRVSIPPTIPGAHDARLELATPDATLGWSALSPPHLFTYDVRAMTHAVLLAFPRERLQAAMGADPELGRVLRGKLAARHAPSLHRLKERS